MPSIKEYNDKLKSLKNTQKITRTMKMVSASKLRKAQDAQVNAKTYAKHVTHLMSRIINQLDSSAHPLLEIRDEVKKVLIVVFTSDKGLCGAFNHNCHKEVLKWLTNNREKYQQIQGSFCGRRGHHFFRKTLTVRNHYDNITIHPNFKEAEKVGQDIIDGFVAKEYDEVYLAYNQFFSPLSQKTIFEKLLPLESESLVQSESVDETQYSYEPDIPVMMNYLIPQFMFFKIFFALLENSAGEHGARMSAMDNASKNASELIDKNTLLRNRARQAQITTELTEIVAGAEALN